MPKITLFEPDRLASPRVGVADRSPKGEGLREYAKDLRGTEEKLDQLATTQAEGTEKIVGDVGQGVANIAYALAQYGHVKNTHQNALAQLQASMDNTAYGDDLATKHQDLKQAYPNDPNMQHDMLVDYASQSYDQALTAYQNHSQSNKYFNDPTNIAILKADLTHTQKKALIASSQEIDGELTKNAHLVGAASLNNELHVLAKSDSTNLNELQKNYLQSDDRLSAAIDTPVNRKYLKGYVDTEKVDKRDKLAQASTVQQMNAVAGLIAVDRINGYKTIQRQVVANKNLLPNSKEEILGKITAAKEGGYKQVAENLESKLADNKLEAFKLLDQAKNINMDDVNGPADLHDIKTELKILRGNVEKGYRLAANDPIIAENAGLQNKVKKVLESGIEHIITVEGEISTKETTYKNTVKAAEIKVTKEASAAEAKADKEAFDTQKQNTIVSLGAKQQALLVQSNPDLARQQRIDLAQSVKTAYRGKLITGTQYNAYITSDLKGAIKSDHYDAQSVSMDAVRSVTSAANTQPGRNVTQVHQAELAAKEVIQHQLTAKAITPTQAEKYVNRINGRVAAAAVIAVPAFKLSFMPDHPQQLRGSKAIVASSAVLQQATNEDHALQIITGLNNKAGLTSEQDEFVQKQIAPYVGTLTDAQLGTLVGSTQTLARKRLPEGVSVYDQIIGAPPTRQSSPSDTDESAPAESRGIPLGIGTTPGDGYGKNRQYPGLKLQGNINLASRRIDAYPHGAVSEGEKYPKADFGGEYSTTYPDKDKGLAVVIPTIWGGAFHSRRLAIEHYKKTGKQLGGFDLATEEKTGFKASDDYATKLHLRDIYINGKLRIRNGQGVE